MCQCPLFKQFTTAVGAAGGILGVFIVCVNVLFLSNSQLSNTGNSYQLGVYRICQCPLFKQFTTRQADKPQQHMVFIVCVNVLFLSNSQLSNNSLLSAYRCLSYVSMSSF